MAYSIHAYIHTYIHIYVHTYNFFKSIRTNSGHSDLAQPPLAAGIPVVVYLILEAVNPANEGFIELSDGSTSPHGLDVEAARK